MSDLHLKCINQKCPNKITKCVECGQELSRFLMLIGAGACSEDCLVKSRESWSGKPNYEFKPRKTPCSKECWDAAFAVDLELSAVKARVAAAGACFYAAGTPCPGNLFVWRARPLTNRQEELNPDNYQLVCKPHGFKHLIKNFTQKK